MSSCASVHEVVSVFVRKRVLVAISPRVKYEPSNRFLCDYSAHTIVPFQLVSIQCLWIDSVVAKYLVQMLDGVKSELLIKVCLVALYGLTLDTFLRL